MKGKNAYAKAEAVKRGGRGMHSWLREAPAAQARFSRRRGGWMGLTPCGDGGLCRSPAF